jgi:hypothetical protein
MPYNLNFEASDDFLTDYLRPSLLSNSLQTILESREAREFASGALAGAMSKAILAPLETIR